MLFEKTIEGLDQLDILLCWVLKSDDKRVDWSRENETIRLLLE